VAVAQAVAAKEFDLAILVSGMGIGMAISANKVAGIRAAAVADVYSAERARKSNDAQISGWGACARGGPCHRASRFLANVRVRWRTVRA